MKNPKLSIISPSYNQGRFIEEAVRSVMDQDYPDYEHIIIDGGSTDDTLAILKNYPHLICISEKDDGQSDALNKGFRMAKGEIIGWLNTDDFYLPGTFRRVAEEFSKNRTDAIYSDFRFIDQDGKITREMRTQNSSKWMSTLYSFIPSTTFFFKRSVLDHGILIDRHFEIAMDMEFFAHIYSGGFSIKRVDAFFAHFRWHQSNKSLNSAKVRRITRAEKLEIFNRYSGFKLPAGWLGNSCYSLLYIFAISCRFTCRTFHIGLYSKNTI